jgi:hypothetical protein
MGINLRGSFTIRHGSTVVVSQEGEPEIQMTVSTDSESSSKTTAGFDRRDVVERGLEELNPEALFMDGLDDAIIGNQYSHPPVVVYDEGRIIACLTIDQGFSYEEAWEWYGFNIAGAWVGENTPIIVVGLDALEEQL